MRFALVDNNKREAAKGLTGVCPNCGSEVTAKCGEVNVNHWAHKGTRSCDPWWENETEWHRAWKNNFPTEWQEIILTDDQTGEKHIADIRTTHDLVIEFQHSHLDPQERRKREHFYKHMVWVVDGTRLKRDYPRFLEGQQDFRTTNERGLFLVHFPDECFPSAWLGSSVPVVFDFKGLEPLDDPNDTRHSLYYLFPATDQTKTYVAALTRESFIDNIKDGRWCKKQQEPQKELPVPPISNQPSLFKRPAPYVYHRGRYVKRRRF